MTTPSAPYVGLDYFLEEDAALFFGRDAERKQIIGNLRASRLTLLYAESGVGKSSLLRAGVSARLRELAARNLRELGSPRYVPVVFNAWHERYEEALVDALAASAEPLLPADGSLTVRRDGLEHAIEDVVQAADATPLLILDQFEEHFTYDSGDERFDDELARCINRPDLRANFLISVREDAYSLIGQRFKARIPNVYGNFLHLDFLEEGAARDAILEPVNAFNAGLAADAPRVEVEPALVDAVLEQVRRGRVTIGGDGGPDLGGAGADRVETAYLQLVMRRLWDEEVAVGSPRLRLQTLRRLGGADAIVHGHLDDVLAELPADQRDAAEEAFRYLVTSRGRKIALSSDELRDLSDADEHALLPALAHLEHERILRPIPSSQPGGIAHHEIYHDVLAPAILEWRRRRAHDALERGLARARGLEVRNRRLGAAVIALVVVVLALALYVVHPGPVQRLELRTVDARFSVRGTRAADPRLVLVAVDDRTRSLSRARYARMLDLLQEGGPAVIALDTIFEGRSDPSGDRALLASIRAAAPRLVLPYVDFSVVSDAHSKQTMRADLLGRPEAVRATGVTTAYAGLPNDRDGRGRRVDYAARTTARVTLPTFAFAAADIVRGGRLARSAPPAGAARRASGGQSDDTTWIDYHGRAGTIRRVSAADVLNGRVSPAVFKDKIVIAGVTARGVDVHRTPMGRMSGAEVQANAVDTILRGAPLRDVSRLVDILVVALCGCLAAMAALVASRLRAAAVIAAVAVVFLGAAQLAFQLGWIVAVVAVLAGIAIAAIGVAGLAVTRARRAP